MVATQATKLSKWDEKIKASAEEEYESFRNVLEWTEDFGLVFVQCAPVQGEELITKVTKDLTTKKIDVLSFQSGEEIRNLYDLVDQMPNRDQIDILFIRGLEYSFVPYIKPGYGGQGDYYKLDNLPPILGHLNLQRERFRQDFDICFVFLLPFFGIKYFIQRAPDFFDWRSGLFEVATDKNLPNELASSIILDNNYTKYMQLSFSERKNRISIIENLLKENLTSEEKASLLVEKGRLLSVDEDYKEALACYNHALEIKPDDYNVLLKRGIALGNLGRLEEEIASYDQALEIKPDFHEAWYNRGIALGNLGRLEEAIASYDQALKIKPDYPDAWNNRGNALFNLGRLEEAIASYDQALKIKPDYPDAWYNRGVALRNLGRLEEAIASYDQVLKIKPDYHKAWYNRGIALRNLGRLEEVIASYDQALEIKPDDPDAWYNRGIALRNLGRIEEAITSFDNALKIKPDKHQAWYYKARVYALQENIPLAITNLQQTINLDSKYLEIAKTDINFDKIRNMPSFQALITEKS
jgi:tetratricopeptide (TPR) repeat protein